MVRLFLAVVFVVVSALTLAPTPALAQGPIAQVNSALTLAAVAIPEAELTTFAKAYKAIQRIREEAEVEMAKAVEAEGFTVEEFNAIANRPAANSAAPAPTTTAENTQAFDSALEAILSLRQQAEATMETAIADTGLSVERFNEILQQSTEDSDLYKQIERQIKKL